MQKIHGNNTQASPGRRVILFTIIFISRLFAAFAEANDPEPLKFALVIGNGAYTDLVRLANPENDANDISNTLEYLGFTVDKILNGSLEQMENGVINFKDRLSENKHSYGFFFYAGHGVQSGGENFLIPVNANIPSESFLRNRSLSVQAMLDELNQAENDLNVIVLDACRDNPFGWSRSGGRGLAIINYQPAGSIIVYATSAGQRASDGEGRNGLFTSQLLPNLMIPGIEVKEVFNRTGADVSRASGNQQRPAIYSQFFETAYLGTGPVQPGPAAAATAPASAPVPRPETAPAAAARPVLEGYVYINGGAFYMGSPENEPGRESNEGPRRQVTVSAFYMGRRQVTQAEYEAVMGTNPSHFKGPNLPVEQVSWFDAVEYCNLSSRHEGLEPAYTISGSGNSRTVAWNRNANGYRLPTEAEWEYACRAGTATAFSTGNNITTSQANYDGNGPYNNNARGEYRQSTTAVGSFNPNPWGLYDMHGNVWEWCWDWSGNYGSEPQTDPTGAVSGSRRVVRGGSWYVNGRDLRSASRDNYSPTNRSSNIGFRLVRPL